MPFYEGILPREQKRSVSLQLRVISLRAGSFMALPAIRGCMDLGLTGNSAAQALPAQTGDPPSRPRAMGLCWAGMGCARTLSYSTRSRRFEHQ